MARSCQEIARVFFAFLAAGFQFAIPHSSTLALLRAMEIPRRNLQHPVLTPKLLAANLSLADTAGLAVVWA